MDFYLDKVSLKDKDTLYRLLQYSLFEESLSDGNDMNENAYLSMSILICILAKRPEVLIL